MTVFENDEMKSICEFQFNAKKKTSKRCKKSERRYKTRETSNNKHENHIIVRHFVIVHAAAINEFEKLKAI